MGEANEAAMNGCKRPVTKTHPGDTCMSCSVWNLFSELAHCDAQEPHTVVHRHHHHQRRAP